MKKIVLLPAILAGMLFISYGCHKTPYSATDNTAGLVNKTRKWSGYSTGYLQGDTLLHPGDTTHYAWAKYYYHTITDSLFAVQKVNGYLITVMGEYMNYISTNPTTKVATFDSTVIGSNPCFLDYYTLTDSCNMEYHHIGTYNTASGHYYETNIYLHQVP